MKCRINCTFLTQKFHNFFQFVAINFLVSFCQTKTVSSVAHQRTVDRTVATKDEKDIASKNFWSNNSYRLNRLNSITNYRCQTDHLNSFCRKFNKEGVTSLLFCFGKSNSFNQNCFYQVLFVSLVRNSYFFLLPKIQFNLYS